MTGKSRFTTKKAATKPATSYRHRLAAFTSSSSSEPLKAYTELPVMTRSFIDDATARRAMELSGHKDYVPLDQVKPGQRVLLDATAFLNETFMFEPKLFNLHEAMTEFSLDIRENKESLFLAYSQLCREVSDVKPMQLYSTAQTCCKDLEKLSQFTRRCEFLAVLRQLCYDEPIPLMDMATITSNKHNGGRGPSKTKARKIGDPSTTDSSQEQAVSEGNNNMSATVETLNGMQGVQGAIPFTYVTPTGVRMALASFAHDLEVPDRLFMPLEEILNVKGYLVTSEAFMLRTYECFDKRKETAKSELQQDYRETFMACNQFIKREGTVRSEEEWRQFITSCVHMYCLRSVLHDKALDVTQPGESVDVDQHIDKLLHMGEFLASKRSFDDAVKQMKSVSLESGGSLDSIAEQEWQKMNKLAKQIKDDTRSDANQAAKEHNVEQQGNALKYLDAAQMKKLTSDDIVKSCGRTGSSLADLEKLEDITLHLSDCTGFPLAAIVNGKKLKLLRERAQALCQHDTAAAKLRYDQLSKSCKKSLDEFSKLQDMAKIGIPQAVEEIQCWIDDCLSWCVLRRVLHNVPMKMSPGRCGTPDQGGVKLPGNNLFALHG